MTCYFKHILQSAGWQPLFDLNKRQGHTEVKEGKKEREGGIEERRVGRLTIVLQIKRNSERSLLAERIIMFKVIFLSLV